MTNSTGTTPRARRARAAAGAGKTHGPGEGRGKAVASATTPKRETANVGAATSPGALSTPLPRETKAAYLRRMLAAQQGASMTELMAATGWQAHTVRAALSGLRKAGLVLVRETRGTETAYRLDAGPEAAPGDDAGMVACSDTREAQDTAARHGAAADPVPAGNAADTTGAEA